MKFVKMHGCGNDYVYLNAVGDAAVEGLMARADWAQMVQRMSDRHKGIGSDGVIVLCDPTDAGRSGGAHVRMRMFNSDGSESEMCGNGVRCVAKYAHDRLGVRANPMMVQTGRGVLSIAYGTSGGKVVSATVDMGEPILDLARVPVDAARVTKTKGTNGYAIQDCKGVFDWQFVSMGNPHAVAFADEEYLDRAKAVVFMSRMGPAVERNPAFPNRTNVHFVTARSRTEAAVYTWERGAGVTQACGTGACASLVAGVLNGLLDREATMHVLGGDLRIRWDQNSNHVFMTGEAVDVFEGEWQDGAPSTARAMPARPVLRTERLVLRPFTLDDAPEVMRLAGDRQVSATTLTVPHPYELHHATGWIATHQKHWDDGKEAIFAVCEQGGGENGTLVGAIGLALNLPQSRAELGYWIGVPYWGRGYATEASEALVRYGFNELGLNRVFSCHFAGNPASGRVMEKMGMKREGLMRSHVKKWGEYHDSVYYGFSRAEWEALEAARRAAAAGADAWR